MLWGAGCAAGVTVFVLVADFYRRVVVLARQQPGRGNRRAAHDVVGPASVPRLGQQRHHCIGQGRSGDVEVRGEAHLAFVAQASDRGGQ